MYDEDAKKPGLKMSYEKYSEQEEPAKVRSAYAMKMSGPGMDKITITSAIDDLTLQADKLNASVLELLRRIEPVRSTGQHDEEGEVVIARVQPEFGSPLAEQIYRITMSLRHTQSYISQAMDDIDL